MAPPKKKLGHQYKYYKGEPVSPVLYNGKHVGHGTYMAAISQKGELVVQNGVPTPYRDLALD